MRRLPRRGRRGRARSGRPAPPTSHRTARSPPQDSTARTRPRARRAWCPPRRRVRRAASAACSAGARRGASTARANRPSPAPPRYLPESAPPASTADATTLTPHPSSAATVASSSTGSRDTRLYGSWAAHGAATPRSCAERARVAHERRRPVEDAPRARLARGDERADGVDEIGERETVGWWRAVDEIEVVEAHPRERRVELGGGTLVGPELEPELVRDDGVVAPPTRLPEQLPEQHLGVPGRDRRGAGAVVVARVVEEVDAALRGRRA